MTATCCAYAETKPGSVTVRFPCAHVYCHDCIIELFDFAVHKDASLFPPRCCKIPISDNIYSFLPAKLLEEVHAKKAIQDYEHSTFCSGCWALIPDDMIEHSVATCSKCQTKTCTTCGDKAHEGLCSEDDDTKLLMATVEKVSWQRCSRCKNMVELSHGCLHIMYVPTIHILTITLLDTKKKFNRCRCDYQFCYKCGKKWKTCPTFDQQHVLSPTPTDALEMAPIVCRHVWNQHTGTACARCDRTGLESIMQCSVCRVEQCTRCVNNRD